MQKLWKDRASQKYRNSSALGFLDDDALKIVGLLRYREKF
jgi:hypothetical protein